MAWIRPLPGGRWAVTSMWPDGVREIGTYESVSEAWEAQLEIEDEILDGAG